MREVIGYDIDGEPDTWMIKPGKYVPEPLVPKGFQKYVQEKVAASDPCRNNNGLLSYLNPKIKFGSN